MKFVGLHGTNKVTVVMHQLFAPDEHMCLVIYDQKCPPRYYNEIDKLLNDIKTFEHKDLATALEGTFLNDGRNLARVLHEEGHLKKVATQNIFMTPYGYDSKNKIRLSELNDIVGKMDAGGEASEKMRKLDESAGMQLNRPEKAPVEAKDTLAKMEAPHSIPEPYMAPVEAYRPSVTLPQAIALSADPKEASLELRNQSDTLNTAALRLLDIAKELKDKAEELFPSTPKRKPGRPKGTFKIKGSSEV